MKHCAPNPSVWYCSGNGIINYKLPDLDRFSSSSRNNYTLSIRTVSYHLGCFLPSFLPSFLHASKYLTVDSLTAPHNFIKKQIQQPTHNSQLSQKTNPTTNSLQTSHTRKPQTSATNLYPAQASSPQTSPQTSPPTSHPNRNPKSTKPTKNAANSPNHHRCSHRGASASGGSR